MATLSDYLYQLETGDRQRRRSYGQDRSLAAPRKPAPRAIDLSQFDAHANYAATLWEKEKYQEWKKDGRIAEDGRLRVGLKPPEPYTQADLMRIWPHLNVFDRLAALIILDGVVEEGYMGRKEHENIRAVVEEIADDRLTRRLQSSDTATIIKDLIRAEVAEIFGEVRLQFKQPGSALKVGGRQMKCSKCRQPGHRATTCKASAEMIAAAKAQEAEGKAASA